MLDRICLLQAAHLCSSQTKQWLIALSVGMLENSAMASCLFGRLWPGTCCVNQSWDMLVSDNQAPINLSASHQNMLEAFKVRKYVTVFLELSTLVLVLRITKALGDQAKFINGNKTRGMGHKK